MLWRMAGGLRSLFGCSRRTMSGKRLVFGILCTVCLTLGVYLKFFNHDSADKLLDANRGLVPDSPGQAKPNFQHLKSHKAEQEVQNANDGDNNERANDIQGNAQRERTFDDHDVEIEQQNLVGEDNENGNKIEKKTYDDWAEDNENNAIPNKDPSGDEIENAIAPEDEVKNAIPAEVPIEDHVEAEKEDDSVVRGAGGNGGERTIDDSGGMEGGGRDEGVRPDGRGPHGIKLFDWNKWVKDNEFVDLGNIWGYCDDENPPVIGKVLLMQDDENGGLKNILIFNISLEYDIVMGSVEVSIDFNGMHFYTNKFDLEDLETESDFFKCPITKGDHYFVREQHISALVPKGHFYGEARMVDQNDRTVLCSTMNMDML